MSSNLEFGYVPPSDKSAPKPSKAGSRLMSAVRFVAGLIKGKPISAKTAGNRMGLLPLVLVAFTAGAQEEPGATMRGSMGASGVLSQRADVVPTALVEVEAPVSLGHESVARVLALLRISGVAGDERFNVGDVSTFNSAEFELWFRRRVGSDYDGGATYFYLHGGGAVLRDSHGDAPFQRNPLWYSAGLTLERRESKRFPKRWVNLGFGHSDISSPPARSPLTLAQAGRDAIPRDLIASGSVEVDGPSKTRFIVSVDVHRGIFGPRASTQVRLSTTATWGE